MFRSCVKSVKCCEMKAMWNLYMVITFLGCIVKCTSSILEREQMQFHRISNLDTAKRYVLPYYTKEGIGYISKMCSSFYCRNGVLSNHRHQPAHSYIPPVPDARLHDHEYTKKNKRSHYQHAINPYLFQYPNLQAADVNFFDVSFLENYKLNKRAANENSDDENLLNNPGLQANIENIFGPKPTMYKTDEQHKQDSDVHSVNVDLHSDNVDLQANIENIFGPKSTLYKMDEQYKQDSDINSDNVDLHSDNVYLQANIENIFGPKSTLHKTDEQFKQDSDIHSDNVDLHSDNADLQANIENIFGPKPTLYKTDEQFKQDSDIHSDNVDLHSGNVDLQTNIEAVFLTKELNKRNTNYHSTFSKSFQYPNLQTAIESLYGPVELPSLVNNKRRETRDQYDTTDNTENNSGQENRLRPPGEMKEIYATATATDGPQYHKRHQNTTNNAELNKTILAVFGTPSTLAAADHSNTTASSHKVDHTDPPIAIQSGNANGTGDDYHLTSSSRIKYSYTRTSSGSHAQKSSVFIYFLCVVTFIVLY